LFPLHLLYPWNICMETQDSFSKEIKYKNQYILCTLWQAKWRWCRETTTQWVQMICTPINSSFCNVNSLPSAQIKHKSCGNIAKETLAYPQSQFQTWIAQYTLK
jgi:hypothetical protein